MRSLKNITGVLGALVGLLYCGGLIFYFVGGWASSARSSRYSTSRTALQEQTLSAWALPFSV